MHRHTDIRKYIQDRIQNKKARDQIKYFTLYTESIVQSDIMKELITYVTISNVYHRRTRILSTLLSKQNSTFA